MSERRHTVITIAGTAIQVERDVTVTGNRKHQEFISGSVRGNAQKNEGYDLENTVQRKKLYSDDPILLLERKSRCIPLIPFQAV